MLQTLTIATVSSLPNVIRLATITKVLVHNYAPDTSFSGGVCRFRSKHQRSEMFINIIVSAKGTMIMELILFFTAQRKSAWSGSENFVDTTRS